MSVRLTDPKLRPRTVRMYQPIWNTIKKARFNTEVPIKVHKSMEKTLIQAVRKEKAAECGVMRKIGEPTYGPLLNRTVVDPEHPNTHIIIYFKLSFNEKLI